MALYPLDTNVSASAAWRGVAGFHNIGAPAIPSALERDLGAVARVETILSERGADSLASEVYSLGCGLGAEWYSLGNGRARAILPTGE